MKFKTIYILQCMLIFSTISCNHSDQNNITADQFVVNKATTNCNCRVQNTKERPQIGSKHLGPFNSRAEAIKAMCKDIDPTMEDQTKCWTTTPADACPRADSLSLLKSRNGKIIVHKTAQGIWQSICQDGNTLPLCDHLGTWFGPERNTKIDADTDGENHHKKCNNHNPETIQW